jgi:uncharacterized cupredoxin-like copper-binding protein
MVATADTDRPQVEEYALADALPDVITVRTVAPEAPASPTRSRRRIVTWNQYLGAQIPVTIAIALVIAAIAFAGYRQLPSGYQVAGAPRAAGAAGAAGGAVTSLTFTSEAVAQQVPVAPDPGGALKWDQATYTAQAGDVAFVVTNKSPLTHDFAIEGNGITAQSANFGPNTTNTFTLKGLKPGQYQIVCNYPGHRAAGMVATLIVK